MALADSTASISKPASGSVSLLTHIVPTTCSSHSTSASSMDKCSDLSPMKSQCSNISSASSSSEDDSRGSGYSLLVLSYNQPQTHSKKVSHEEFKTVTETTKLLSPAGDENNNVNSFSDNTVGLLSTETSTTVDATPISNSTDSSTITPETHHQNGNTVNTPLTMQDNLTTLTGNLQQNSLASRLHNDAPNDHQLSEVSANATSSLDPARKSRKRDKTTQKLKCAICLSRRIPKKFPSLPCVHQVCRPCLKTYVHLEINESRTAIGCPASKTCHWRLGRGAVERLVEGDSEMLVKWDRFKLQNCLYTMPGIVFCPFPDCTYAVIAPRDCKKCPRIECQACQKAFCYNCRNEWEDNHIANKCLKKDERRPFPFSSSTRKKGSKKDDFVKPCPRCGALISKVQDGSCNHINCSVCHCEFCWLCLREVSDVHFLSPSGCTFWGTEIWSTRKRVTWQLLMFLLSPLIILCCVLISIPAIIIGMPLMVYRYVNLRATKFINNTYIVHILVWSVTFLTALVSPVAAICGAILVLPVSMLLVWCLIPIDLIRNGTFLNIEQRLNNQSLFRPTSISSDEEKAKTGPDSTQCTPTENEVVNPIDKFDIIVPDKASNDKSTSTDAVSNATVINIDASLPLLASSSHFHPNSRDQPTSPLESPPDSAGNASSACLPVTPTITSSRDETELLVGNLATERVPLLETETATNLTPKPPLEAGTRMELSVLRPALLDPSCEYEITC